MIKTIPLKDVSNALMCARIKQIAKVAADGRPFGRAAAFTQYPLLGMACRERLRGHNYPTIPHTFGVVSRGDIERLVDRVRLERGRAEVQRTWGVGIRALRLELADGVMR